MRLVDQLADPLTLLNEPGQDSHQRTAQLDRRTRHRSIGCRTEHQGGGFIGFMLGTTANALAVMRTLTERYGPAPRAFLVAPIVGAFFIDFTNALLITACLNIWS